MFIDKFVYNNKRMRVVNVFWKYRMYEIIRAEISQLLWKSYSNFDFIALVWDATVCYL